MSNEPEVAGDQLRSFAKRIEALDDEINELQSDKKEVYAEAKANGYDVKILKKVITLRRRDLDERKEEEAILDLYMQAIGESRDETLKGKGARAQQTQRDAAAQADLYAAAVRVVQSDGKASPSHLQRRMGLGYNRACSFIERMEKEGIVSAADDAGKRRVLASDATEAEEAAKAFKETLDKAGATVSIVTAGGGKSSVMERVATELEKQGIPVQRQTKPLVGSFAPKPENPFSSDD